MNSLWNKNNTFGSDILRGYLTRVNSRTKLSNPLFSLLDISGNISKFRQELCLLASQKPLALKYSKKNQNLYLIELTKIREAPWRISLRRCWKKTRSYWILTNTKERKGPFLLHFFTRLWTLFTNFISCWIVSCAPELLQVTHQTTRSQYITDHVHSSLTTETPRPVKPYTSTSSYTPPFAPCRPPPRCWSRPPLSR